ncbi:hypothetical protein L0337_31530 [candidate division KSB1 bacterium]|nr:hypothetical protein [candidate division KSB1 bacterium]
MKRNIIRTLAAAALALMPALIFTSAHAQDNLVVIDRIYPKELQVEGFILDRDQEIKVEAVGAYLKQRRDEMILGTAWILNAQSREVVWEFAAEEPRDERRAQAQSQAARLDLAAGAYEVYYASFQYFHNEGDWSYSSGVEKFLFGKSRSFFDRGFNDDDYYDLCREFKVIVKGQGRRMSQEEILKNQEAGRADAVIALAADDDDFYGKQGFELERPLKLQIEALGEARKGDESEFDYGWIVNVDTREKAWKFLYRDSEHAGGADKNRWVSETISLPAGKYAAIFVTDDSHSPYKWNSPPPYDPSAWGMFIRVAEPDKRYVKKFEYKVFEEQNTVLSLTPMRDDDFRSQGFTLKRPMKLRIYAIGEGTGKDMADYGWIVDAKTQKKVWEMRYYDTEHAGGAHKNRMQDEIVQLAAGSYMAYFVTDDSHAHREWNSSPPYDPEHWGLTIVAAEANFSRSDVANYEPSADPSILASIVGVRDHANKRVSFTLKKDTEVRIYALGEGSGGDMYDYGWIENAETGRVVWEMGYRMTDHAGGASKNRMFNGTILLKAGNYNVYYESDDSHSFNSWNSSPPHDPMNWGITVSVAE